MSRTLSLKVTGGMDTALRVLVTLRRKQFDVQDFLMQNAEEMRVTILDHRTSSATFERAMLYMQKLTDVYDVQEV